MKNIIHIDETREEHYEMQFTVVDKLPTNSVYINYFLDVDEAVEHLKQEPVDLIIIDIVVHKNVTDTVVELLNNLSTELPIFIYSHRCADCGFLKQGISPNVKTFRKPNSEKLIEAITECLKLR